jgi:hypothetical protein
MHEVKDGSVTEDKTCPKCGSRMLSDRTLGSAAIPISLIRENEFRGDDVKTYYCEDVVSWNSTVLRTGGGLT